ncbi:MAG TPA: lipopolysaccharide biosynthesis protein [Lacipirellulaceae bacterium]
MSRLSGAAFVPRISAARAEWMQGIWVVADQAVVSLASFLALVVVGRTCSQADLGVYGLAVYTLWLAVGIPNALVWVPYTARAARLSQGRRRFFAGSATIHVAVVAFVLAGSCLAAAAVAYFTSSASPWIAPMCLALAPFSLMMIAREHARRLNLADLRVQDLLRIDVPNAVLQMLLLLALARFGMLTATTALLAVALACANTFSWFYRNLDRFEFHTGRALLHWGYNRKFGLWLLVVAVAWLVGESSGRWMVGLLYGRDMLGQFVAAQGIVMAINPLLLTINNLAQSMSSHGYARGGAAELRRMAVRGTLYIALGTGAALICLAMIGGPAVHFFFGDKYIGLGHVVTSLCLGMFARMLVMPIEAAMVALQYGRTMLVAAILRLLLIVGCGVPLIWWIGLEGVGYAMAISAVGAGVVQWYTFLQLKQQPALSGAV